MSYWPGQSSCFVFNIMRCSRYLCSKACYYFIFIFMFPPFTDASAGKGAVARSSGCPTIISSVRFVQNCCFGVPCRRSSAVFWGAWSSVSGSTKSLNFCFRMTLELSAVKGHTLIYIQMTQVFQKWTRAICCKSASWLFRQLYILFLCLTLFSSSSWNVSNN